MLPLLVIAVLLAFVCMWIAVPPPNGAAIIATVASIELSPYLLLVNALILFAALRSRDRLRLAAACVAGLNVVVCALPLAALLRAGIPLQWPTSMAGPERVVELAIPVTLGRDRTAIRAYLPRSGARNPIVIAIYGGAWQHGTPENDSSLNRALAANGYAVFALDYRHAPQARYPAALEDVRAEVTSILNHATRYRADATRVAILGHSSGGQLAELCAFASPATYRALISYSGAVDLAKGYEFPPTPDPINVPSVIATYMGATPENAPERYRNASPLSHVRRGLPPTLLIYGDRDHVVDYSYALKLRDALRDNGNDVTFTWLPWTEHGFEDVPFGLHAPIALAAVEGFLRTKL